MTLWTSLCFISHSFTSSFVSSRTSVVKASGIIKKSEGHLHWFCFRHFTVLKDISTEYFIQMNKARLCCTFIFSDGLLRMSLTLFRFLLLHAIPYAHAKGSLKILSYRHTSRFLPRAHCHRLCFKRARLFCKSMGDSTFEPSFRYMCFFWFNFTFCLHVRQVFLQDGSRL